MDNRKRRDNKMYVIGDITNQWEENYLVKARGSNWLAKWEENCNLLCVKSVTKPIRHLFCATRCQALLGTGDAKMKRQSSSLRNEGANMEMHRGPQSHLLGSICHPN